MIFFYFNSLGNKVEDGEIIEDAEVVKDAEQSDAAKEVTARTGIADPLSSSLQQSGRSWKDGNQRAGKNVSIVSPVLGNLVLNCESY